eukprot:scaffold121001_cov32-Tisochrysis_lutea.AAC.1
MSCSQLGRRRLTLSIQSRCGDDARCANRLGPSAVSRKFAASIKYFFRGTKSYELRPIFHSIESCCDGAHKYA